MQLGAQASRSGVSTSAAVLTHKTGGAVGFSSSAYNVQEGTVVLHLFRGTEKPEGGS